MIKKCRKFEEKPLLYSFKISEINQKKEDQSILRISQYFVKKSVNNYSKIFFDKHIRRTRYIHEVM